MLRLFRGRPREGVPADDPGSLGRRGEVAACRYLRRHGYRILAQRFRTRIGEIDLVAEEGGEIVFVEVKTRRGDRCGTPEEAVDARKRRRLARLAQAFLQQRRLEDRPCRFDVIAVLWEAGRRPRVDHFRHAFTLDEIGPEPGIS